MAILLGLEFYLVFERTTSNYRKSLKDGYSMLIVTKSPMELQAFKSLNEHVESLESINREEVVSEVIKGVNETSEKERS